MKRLFLPRCLVYGSLVLCFATLVAMGRVGRLETSAPLPVRASRFVTAEDMHPSYGAKPIALNPWHEGVPALEQPMELHLTDASLAQSVARLAHLTHLNLACYDARGAGRLSLNLSQMPAWKAMDILARACGGSWQRDGDVFTLQIGVA